ncbi:MAG: hypothetical protein EOP06_04320 [Proteobacteria bacterium]|nr:MAG: hypothetical protein EOP06_04320 [Pseudomonadota bacterium]
MKKAYLCHLTFGFEKSGMEKAWSSGMMHKPEALSTRRNEIEANVPVVISIPVDGSEISDRLIERLIRSAIKGCFSECHMKSFEEVSLDEAKELVPLARRQLRDGPGLSSGISRVLDRVSESSEE